MQKKSLNSAKVKLFKMNYKEILEALKKYGEKMLEKGAKVIILIGSLAKGNYTAFSDADVIIISDNVPENLLDRIKMFIDPTLPIDIQPRVYTTKEILKMAHQKRKIIEEILNHGKILAGDEKILKEIERSLGEKRY
ncbi:MAG: nucleotidyltransferase domain-containing protein [Candidatus Njordarchaeales archaeon]